MATVLAYTSPALGHLNPLMPILLELSGRGHRVHVRTLDSLVDLVRRQGLEAEPIDPRIDPVRDQHPDWGVDGARQRLKRSAAMFAARAAYDGPDLLTAIDATDPDVLIVDTNSWGALTAAEAQPRPWVHFAPYVPPLPSRGEPPYGPGLAPLAGRVGRLRDAALRPAVVGVLERSFLPSLNELRDGYGLPRVRHLQDFLLACPRMVVTTSQPFDYPHVDWPAHVHLIGATPWEEPADPPDWLAELEEPLTLVTTSSEYQADEALVRAAVAGLAGEPGSVLITMPAGVPDDLGPLPANVRVARFVPHSAALARARVAVTHGGMGATQKALAAGVPVCVVPFGRDQLENAARVVNADAGTRLSVRRLTPERLRDAVRLAATKSAGARRCAEGYVAAGQATAGADVVEGLVPVRD